MTKPDDIDQDAWEKAGRAWVRGASSENITNSGRETVARAIMSARAEEREACAKVADNFLWCLPLYEKGADANIASDDAACAVQAEIAAAIRNRP